MNWFVLRQHRNQFLIIGILFVLFAAVMVPTGLHFWHTYQSTLAACKQNPATPGCSDLSGSLFQSSIDQLLFRLMLAVPLLLAAILGMFWGAPLIAREYTEGTNNLVWTQSVSRRRWLTVKLSWVLLATAVSAGAFAALITWWARTPNALVFNRFVALPFTAQGIVPVALSLFVVAFGIMFGAWFRKTMVAVGLTLGLFVVAFIVMPNFVRPHYTAPVTVTAPMGPDALAAKIPTDAWVISQNIVDKNGKTFNSFNLADMPSQCQQIIQRMQTTNQNGEVHVKATPGSGIDTCLNNAGYHQTARYQPAYRYWDFQRIESGIYVGLAALAVGTTYWLVLRRDS